MRSDCSCSRLGIVALQNRYYSTTRNKEGIRYLTYSKPD